MANLNLIEVEDLLIDYMMQRASYGSSLFQTYLDYLDNNAGLTHAQYQVVVNDYAVDVDLIDEKMDPGRRIIVGKVLFLQGKIDSYGPYVWAVITMPNNKLIGMRKPRHADWQEGEVVQVAATVEPLNGLGLNAIGRNPRKITPGKTQASEAKRHVSDIDDELVGLLDGDSS